MEIGFSDARRQRIFSDLDLLRSQFGVDLAEKIAIRLFMLKAASNLAAVDTRRPIRLRPVKSGTREFTVDLAGDFKLRFRARPSKDRRADLSSVVAIEILDVDA